MDPLGLLFFAGLLGALALAMLQSKPSPPTNRTSTYLAPPQERAKTRPVEQRDAPSPPGRCRCGGTWRRRVNGSTGGKFWGCSNFPRCRNTYHRQKKGL